MAHRDSGASETGKRPRGRELQPRGWRRRAERASFGGSRAVRNFRVVVATRTFSDFARAVPNLKRLEFRFPFLENRSALLDRLFV